MNEILIYLFFLIIGGGLFGMGLASLTGRERCWYFLSNHFFWRAKLIPAIGIPAGLLFLLPLLISLLFPNSPGWIRQWIGMTLVAATLICALLSSVIRPKWVRWLEREHYDIIPLIVEEVNKTIGCREWTRRTRTQQELELWVTQFKEEKAVEIERHKQEEDERWSGEISIPIPQKLFQRKKKWPGVTEKYSVGTSVIVNTGQIINRKGKIIGTPIIDEDGKPGPEPFPNRYTVQFNRGNTIFCREECISLDEKK